MRAAGSSVVTALAVLAVACKSGWTEPTVAPEVPVELIFSNDAGARRAGDPGDLAQPSATLDWQVVGVGSIPPKAQALHEEAQLAGSRGDYDKALKLLDQAHLLAPDWPYPLYDAAYTHMLKGDLAKAEALYEQVDKMSPRGFFTNKTSLDCLRRERTGKVPAGFCKGFEALEWVADPAQKRAALEAVVAKTPGYPPAWLKLEEVLDDDRARLDAIQKGLSGEPDAETKGMLLLNKAVVMNRQGDKAGALKLLGELVADSATTLGVEALAKSSIDMIRGK